MTRIREIDEATARLAVEKSEALETLRTGGDATVYRMFSPFADFSGRTEQQLAALRQQAVTAFERRKAAVASARQKLEVIDKCKEKALTEWTAALAREQEAVSSELFLASTARQLRLNRSVVSGQDRPIRPEEPEP